MSHLVIYSGADGQRLHHQVEGLEDAVRHVEQLRNAGQGNDARIFRMVEVPIEVKTYYRVEIAASDEKVAPAKPAVPAEPVAEAPVAEPPAPVAPAPVTPAAPTPAAPAAASAAPAAAPAGPAPVKGEPVAATNGGRFGLFGKS